MKPIGGPTYQKLLQILHKTQPSNCQTTPTNCKMMQLVRFYRDHFAHTISQALNYYNKSNEEFPPQTVMLPDGKFLTSSLLTWVIHLTRWHPLKGYLDPFFWLVSSLIGKLPTAKWKAMRPYKLIMAWLCQYLLVIPLCLSKSFWNSVTKGPIYMCANFSWSLIWKKVVLSGSKRETQLTRVKTSLWTGHTGHNIGHKIFGL